jgi:hypothetical protein
MLLPEVIKLGIHISIQDFKWKSTKMEVSWDFYEKLFHFGLSLEYGVLVKIG